MILLLIYDLRSFLSQIIPVNLLCRKSEMPDLLPVKAWKCGSFCTPWKYIAMEIYVEHREDVWNHRNVFQTEYSVSVSVFTLLNSDLSYNPARPSYVHWLQDYSEFRIAIIFTRICALTVFIASAQVICCVSSRRSIFNISFHISATISLFEKSTSQALNIWRRHPDV
jgi:hypothetical protein